MSNIFHMASTDTVSPPSSLINTIMPYVWITIFYTITFIIYVCYTEPRQCSTQDTPVLFRNNNDVHNHYRKTIKSYEVHDYILGLPQYYADNTQVVVTTGYIIIPRGHPWFQQDLHAINKNNPDLPLEIKYSQMSRSDCALGWELPGEYTAKAIQKIHKSFVKQAIIAQRKKDIEIKKRSEALNL